MRAEAARSIMSEERENLLQVIFEKSDLEALKLYINKGFDVCAQHEQTRCTLLHVAAALLDVDQKEQHIAAALINKGIAVDARDKRGRTALMLCRSTEIAAVLLRHGADVHAACAKKKTALHYAAHSAHAAMVQFLLTAGASAAVFCNHDETPLSLACSNRDFEVSTLNDCLQHTVSCCLQKKQATNWMRLLIPSCRRSSCWSMLTHVSCGELLVLLEARLYTEQWCFAAGLTWLSF